MIRPALAYVARGFTVVPCWPRTKRPAPPTGLKDAAASPEDVRRLWVRRMPYNLACVTGEPSGVFVVDVDGEQGAASLSGIEQAHQPLPDTLTCLTGKGSHLYFRHPGARVRPSQSRIGPGIDVRGDGSMAMLPPSIHPSGQPYRWAVPDVPIAPAPAWLLEIIQREPERPSIPRRIIADRHWSDHDVQRMLDVLDPDMPRDGWVRVGMALHSGGFPFEMYDAWSAGAKRTDERGKSIYDPRTCAAQWRGFRDGAVTMGTLYAMAKTAGWEPERRPCVSSCAKKIGVAESRR